MEATPAKRRALSEPSAALGFLVAILVLVGILLRLVYPEQMRQFERIINPYWPSIIGLMLPLLLLLAVWRNWFAQLSDIINPNSAAEVRRYWFRLGTVHFTLNWIINLLVALAVWGFLLYVIVSVNHLQAVAGPQPDPEDLRRAPVLHLLNGESRFVEHRFFRLVLWTWLIGSAPLVWCVAALRVYRSRNLRQGRHLLEEVDVHGAAMLGSCSLLLTLSISLTESLLGLHSNVGWFLMLLPWAPVTVFVLVLFSRWWWTEAGKGIWNQPRPGQDEKPIRTMKLLETRPAVPKSQALYHESADVPARDRSPLEPLVIICASGGGSRAALFTAGILSRMWWQTVGDDGLDRGPFANLPTADPEQEADEDPARYPGRLLLQYADVISSVSGGSLASAYLVDALYRHMQGQQQNAPDAGGRSCLPLTARHRALASFFSGTDGSDRRPPVIWRGKPKQPTALQEFFGPDNRAPRLSERELERFECNPYICAMRQDHLAAAISGFLLPTIGRSPAIEEFWEGNFQWCQGPKQPRLLADLYDLEREGRLPILILNSTLTRTTTRIAITNLDSSQFQELYKFGPRVDARDLGEGEVNASAAGDGGRELRRAERRYDPLPAQINTLNELDPFWRIPLKTAVRASANFPAGFPLLRFVRRGITGVELSYHGGEDLLELSDGGLIDNTGVDSAMALLRANRTALRERGVLIFQINSGELPRNPGPTRLDFLLHHLTEVKNALWRSNLNLQSALQSLYIDELRDLVGGDIEPMPIKGRTPATQEEILGYAGTRFAYFCVRAGEMTNQHVMTSWHLNWLQRVSLYNQICEPQHGETILRAAEWLAGRIHGNRQPSGGTAGAEVLA